MSYPNLKFNNKRIKVSSTARLVSPIPDIPADTLRFEFLDGYDPTNPSGIYADYKTAKGTWSHVYGNVYDWTCHDPKWYVVGFTTTHSGPYLFSAFASTPVSAQGPIYADTDGNPLASKPFRIIGGNTSNITHMPKLFYRLGAGCTEVGFFDTHNVVNAAEMFRWQGAKGMHAPTLPDFDFSGITNEPLTDEVLSPTIRNTDVGLYDWSTGNRYLEQVPSLTFPANRAIKTAGMFASNTALASASLSGLSSSDAQNMFSGDTRLASVSLINCTLTNTSSMFASSSIETVSMTDVSVSGSADSMFNECSSLETVPMFDTSNITNMNRTFYNNYNVESGALALYQQASSQATPPSNHTYTFTNCGRDTVTGAAELAQIPTDWGGTGS